MKLRGPDEIRILKDKLHAAEGELSIIKGIGMNSPEVKEWKNKVEYLTNQNTVLKTAIRKAVGQIHTLKYENDVLNRKIKIAEDWVGQLREAGL